MFQQRCWILFILYPLPCAVWHLLGYSLGQSGSVRRVCKHCKAVTLFFRQLSMTIRSFFSLIQTEWWVSLPPCEGVLLTHVYLVGAELLFQHPLACGFPAHLVALGAMLHLPFFFPNLVNFFTCNPTTQNLLLYFLGIHLCTVSCLQIL